MQQHTPASVLENDGTKPHAPRTEAPFGPAAGVDARPRAACRAITPSDLGYHFVLPVPNFEANYNHVLIAKAEPEPVIDVKTSMCSGNHETECRLFHNCLACRKTSPPSAGVYVAEMIRG